MSSKASLQKKRLSLHSPTVYNSSLSLNINICLAISDYLGPTDSFHLKAACKHIHVFNPDFEFLHFNPFLASISEVHALLENEKFTICSKLVQKEQWEDIIFGSEIVYEDYGEDVSEIYYHRIISYCIMNGFSKRYEDALIAACTCGNLELFVHLIFLELVDPSFDANSAIMKACQHGHAEIVKLLLKDDRVDPSCLSNIAITVAAENGHEEIVKLLLADKRVDPSDNDNVAFRLAAENGHFKIVKELLADDRIDPSGSDNFAICAAAEIGHLEMVELILSNERFDPSVGRNDALSFATRKGHLVYC